MELVLWVNIKIAMFSIHLDELLIIVSNGYVLTVLEIFVQLQSY